MHRGTHSFSKNQFQSISQFEILLHGIAFIDNYDFLIGESIL